MPWAGLSHTCVSVSSSAPPAPAAPPTRQLQLRAAVYCSDRVGLELRLGALRLPLPLPYPYPNLTLACSVPSRPSVKVPAGQLRLTWFG